MPTIAKPDSEVNLKLRKEARRFEREPIQKPAYRARCLDCEWAFQSESSTEIPEPAETKAVAHRTVAKHRTEVVFDIVGVHFASFHPANDEAVR